MNDRPTIELLLERMRSVQQDLEREFDRLLEEKRAQFQYSIRRGKVVFEKQARRMQRRQRTGLWRYVRETPLAYLLSAPLIYGMIVPLLVLDLSITVYQQVCFRIYRIPRVRRGEYLAMDRHRLGYLNAIEKLNCVYCSYANGLMAYAREVTARTEQFWCPIKHARRTRGAHHRTQYFLDYGDAEAWRQKLQVVRVHWPDVEADAPGAVAGDSEGGR